MNTELLTNGQFSLKGLTDEQLLARLDEVFVKFGNLYHECAEICRELERRGINLLAIKHPLIHRVRKIASGQMLPEVAAIWNGKPGLMDRIGNLPLSDQHRLVDGGKLEVVVYEGGQRTLLQLAPGEMSGAQVNQVFARDHLRSQAEQNAYLADVEGREVRAKIRREHTERVGCLELDRDRRGAMHKGQFISYEDLARAVRLLDK